MKIKAIILDLNYTLINTTYNLIEWAKKNDVKIALITSSDLQVVELSNNISNFDFFFSI